MKIAFLGPEGSYSHLSAKVFLKMESKGGEYLNDWDECIPFRNFYEVLFAVESGRVDACAIPIENSLQGGVSQNLDLLQEAKDLYAVKEYVLPIEHRLVHKSGISLGEIGRVYSHRQALDQCSKFLNAQLPFASLRETESTKFGLAKAMEDESGKSAAIVGAHTDNLLPGFEMSEACISDERNNFTQFLLLKKGKASLPSNGNRIFFSAVCPHRKGSLVELLQIISAHDVNMTKIESRPVKGRPGDFRFFIEANCDIASANVTKMLSAIEQRTLEWKFLGAYRREI